MAVNQTLRIGTRELRVDIRFKWLAKCRTRVIWSICVMPVRKSVPLTYWLENICRHAVFKRRHVPLRSVGEDPVMPVKRKLGPSKNLLQTATLLSFGILGSHSRAHSDLQRMSVVNIKLQ